MNRISVAVATALIGFSTVAHGALTLQPVGRYQSQTAGFDKGAAEIVAYDASTQRIFVVNAQDGTVDVLDGSNPGNPVKVGQIDAKAIPGYTAAGLGSANSVAARDGLVAVAIEASPLTNPGVIAFYDASTLAFLRSVPAGALPDAVTFSNTGHFVIVSNEGEPRFPVDPEGSVTVVDVRSKGGRRGFDACNVNFRAFNSQRAALVSAGVYIDPGAASVAQDLEPEYATAQGNNAYVTLQENNAIAVVQLNQCRVARIMPLGVKDLGLPQNSLDTSDREIDSGKGKVAIRSWQNLYALYQPDSIASYEADDGATYLVIANEGDVRDTVNSGRPSTDAVRVGSLTLDPAAFPAVPASVSPDPNPASSKNLGRLNVIRSLGCEVALDANGFCPGEYDRLYRVRRALVLDLHQRRHARLRQRQRLRVDHCEQGRLGRACEAGVQRNQQQQRSGIRAGRVEQHVRLAQRRQGPGARGSGRGSSRRPGLRLRGPRADRRDHGL